MKGKGANLPDTLVPELPLPLTVQLVNDSNSVCFESVFGVADVINDGERAIQGQVAVSGRGRCPALPARATARYQIARLAAFARMRLVAAVSGRVDEQVGVLPWERSTARRASVASAEVRWLRPDPGHAPGTPACPGAHQ